MEKETKQPPNIITDPIKREPPSRVMKNHPTDLILGNMDESMVTRIRYANLIQFLYSVSSLEPENVKVALMDEAWIRAMQAELARLVAQGYTQVEGIDFDELFAPVASLQSIRRGNVDKTLFIKNIKSDVIFAQIYVDDIVFGSTSNSEVQVFVLQMQQEFEMSMVGELTYFLGLQVKQSDYGSFVSQSKYAKNLVKKFGLENTKHTNTPMSKILKLSKDEQGEKVDPTLYQSMIGSLLYLTASHPDICYSVGVCARYQGNPMESHISVVKRIIRYVNSTIDFGILFSKDTNTNLVCFSDVNWARNANDRNSTSGGCFFLGNNLISWHSKKKICVSLSTTEAEYIDAGSCCTQLLWMKQMMEDHGFDLKTLTIFCDNTSSINISKNHVQHSRTKHIDIRHHFIRELV
ncbi:uncharacterized mitochondrial protein AtMg00810-like [Humulus lupulus]|uniref:uncharacterized mitochondrial protein AtMg00810-like n=1 Tax=Humulus lupulus TaxID=3486 RepID=UPI002B40C356|nr:uncharacterized mitochondrial protein AtMg00810-like [Humulus lupulus]